MGRNYWRGGWCGLMRVRLGGRGSDRSWKRLRGSGKAEAEAKVFFSGSENSKGAKFVRSFALFRSCFCALASCLNSLNFPARITVFCLQHLFSSQYIVPFSCSSVIQIVCLI